MSKFIKSIDIEKLQQAAIFVTENGTIEKVNSIFCKMFGWQPQEIQKQNVSLIISPKIMKKSAHDAKLKAYKLNKESAIIGKPRVLPVKNSSDEEEFVNVQIIPIGTSKSFCFLCFFSAVYEREKFVSDGELKDLLQELINNFPATDSFSTTSGEHTQIISVTRSFIEGEVTLISKFLSDNWSMEEAWQLGKFMIMKQKVGNLHNLYDMLLKRFEEPRIVYVNLVFLKIIYPSLAGHKQLISRLTEFGRQLNEEAKVSSRTYSKEN